LTQPKLIRILHVYKTEDGNAKEVDHNHR